MILYDNYTLDINSGFRSEEVTMTWAFLFQGAFAQGVIPWQQQWFHRLI